MSGLPESGRGWRFMSMTQDDRVDGVVWVR